MATRKILSTNNYELFKVSSSNRPLDLNRHRALEASMKEYGFLPVYPIICYREGGKLFVKDGQHRLSIAQTHGLDVYYVETDVEYDNAKINGTPKPWLPRDYAATYAEQGKKDYITLMEFSDTYKLPVALSACMLAGVTTFMTVKAKFDTGRFAVVDRAFADRCAVTYTQVVSLSSAIKNARFLQAVMGACRVPEFSPHRFVANAKRCAEKLLGYSTNDAYLAMIEDVYNYGQKRPYALRIEAIKAMRLRNPATRAADAVA